MYEFSKLGHSTAQCRKKEGNSTKSAAHLLYSKDGYLNSQLNNNVTSLKTQEDVPTVLVPEKQAVWFPKLATISDVTSIAATYVHSVIPEAGISLEHISSASEVDIAAVTALPHAETAPNCRKPEGFIADPVLTTLRRMGLQNDLHDI